MKMNIPMNLLYTISSQFPVGAPPGDVYQQSEFSVSKAELGLLMYSQLFLTHISLHSNNVTFSACTYGSIHDIVGNLSNLRPVEVQ